MTAAATDLAAVAPASASAVQAGPETARRRPSGAAGRAVLRPVPDAPATVATGLSEDGSAVVAAADLPYVRAALLGALPNHANHGGQPAVAAAYRRILASLGGRVPATSRPVSPEAAGVAAGADETDLAAVVDGLDGSERKLLLARLADSDPVAVEAGLRWLAEWHAGNAERRRTDRNRKAKDRRRRQRAQS